LEKTTKGVRFVQRFDIRRLVDSPLEVSRITCEFKTWRSQRNHRTGGLAAFRGIYAPGSAGKNDARQIQTLLQEFYHAHRPDGLVLDCRELEYTWGDDLDFPENEPVRTERFPLLIVLRREQQEAYAYAISRELHRNDLENALAEIDEAIRGMKSLL